LRCIPGADTLTCGLAGFAEVCRRPRSANPAQAGRRVSIADWRNQVVGPCTRCGILPVSPSKAPCSAHRKFLASVCAGTLLLFTRHLVSLALCVFSLIPRKKTQVPVVVWTLRCVQRSEMPRSCRTSMCLICARPGTTRREDNKQRQPRWMQQSKCRRGARDAGHRC
jgi:hypothetical protein